VKARVEEEIAGERFAGSASWYSPAPSGHSLTAPAAIGAPVLFSFALAGCLGIERRSVPKSFSPEILEARRG
jgi:hypothetical protein